MLVIVWGYAANCVVLVPGLSCMSCVSFQSDRYSLPEGAIGRSRCDCVRLDFATHPPDAPPVVTYLYVCFPTLPSYTTAERLAGFRPVFVAQETEISASRMFTIDSAVPLLSAAAAAAAVSR